MCIPEGKFCKNLGRDNRTGRTVNKCDYRSIDLLPCAWQPQMLSILRLACRHWDSRGTVP